MSSNIPNIPENRTFDHWYYLNSQDQKEKRNVGNIGNTIAQMPILPPYSQGNGNMRSVSKMGNMGSDIPNIL